MPVPPARDTAGRFAPMPSREPELTLSTWEPGTQVSYRGIPGHRVVEATGDMLTLRPPEGGVVLATPADVTEVPETPQQRQENLQVEVGIATMLASARTLSRQRRAAMDTPTGPAQQQAMEALSELFSSGRIPMGRYVYAMRATHTAPVGASHAALAIAARPHLDAVHYEALTRAARAAGATLPQ